MTLTYHATLIERALDRKPREAGARPQTAGAAMTKGKEKKNRENTILRMVSLLMHCIKSDTAHKLPQTHKVMRGVVPSSLVVIYRELQQGLQGALIGRGAASEAGKRGKVGDVGRQQCLAYIHG